jgi:nitrogen regulatory protein PII
MPSPEERSATTVVMEMEPGRIYVKIVEPKPEPNRIEMLLRLTIEQWSNAHPQLVIDKAEAVTDHGVMQGIHVWYHVNDRQLQPTSPTPPQQPISLTIEVRNEILRKIPKEHIEAIVDEAIEIWRSQQHGHGTIFVINPRRIAVVLDKQANRGAVVPVELIYPAIEDATRTKVQSWLEAPPTRFLVVQIAGSWFLFHQTEAQRSKIVDPPFLGSNMTYDTEPPPTV